MFRSQCAISSGVIRWLHQFAVKSRLLQLQAKKFVPPELSLVNLFGYTLGGFYLARYSDSPVGPFDELVALAGLAWNFPASCAWAARVYVNNKEARDHGVSSVGLPSRLAEFKAISLPSLHARNTASRRSNTCQQSWWDVNAAGSKAFEGAAADTATMAIELCNLESTGRGLLGRRKGSAIRGLRGPVCMVDMPEAPVAWGPHIQLFLPSFSGATPEYPGLLKYTLRLMTNVQLLKPLRVRVPGGTRPPEDLNGNEVLDRILAGRPLLCMAFKNMEMEVQAPEAWEPKTRKGHGVAINQKGEFVYGA